MTEATPSAAPELASALAGVLDAENAAVWAYGRIGAAESGDAQADARDALRAHRSARDRIRQRMNELGLPPAPPPAAYESPEVTDAAAAAAWAQRTELALVPRYSSLAAAEQGAQRVAAATEAQVCATRAISWGASSQALPGIGTPSDAATASADTKAPGSS